MKDIKPLPPYKEPLYYTGFISGLTLILGIIFIYKQIFTTFQIPLIILGGILGFLTYFMWETRCPKCKRPFSKKEDESKEKDLEVKEIKREFVSEIFKLKGGENDGDIIDKNKDYRLWPARFVQKFFYCNKCDWADYNKEGSFKKWEDNDKWNPPTPKIIYVKETEDGYVRIGKGSKSNGKIIVKPLTKYEAEKIILQRRTKCEYPPCRETERLDVHHIVARSNGGTNNPSNLVVLCPTHHRSADRGNINATRLKMIVANKTKGNKK